MKVKYDRLLCYVLIGLMFILGMCLENTKADSFFEYTLVKDATFDTDEQNREKIGESSCTTEMLQKTGKSVVKNAAKHIVSRKSGKETAFLLSAQFMTHYFSCVYDNILLQFPEKCGNTMVLHYIHDKDGEK